MDYLAVISAEAARIAEIGRSTPPEASIPHIGGWTVEDVIAHLGDVHRWATGIVTTRTFARRQPTEDHEEGEALVRWFEDGARRLVSVLASTDPEEPCPNFSRPSPQSVRFWSRRQAHETTMHRWDIEAAGGMTTQIDSGFADDGIDELFHTFTRIRGRQSLSAPVRIVASDTGSRWTLIPGSEPGRVAIGISEEGPVATIEGPAEKLLLTLWKRLPLDEIDVVGDRQVASAFVAGPLSP